MKIMKWKFTKVDFLPISFDFIIKFYSLKNDYFEILIKKNKNLLKWRLQINLEFIRKKIMEGYAWKFFFYKDTSLQLNNKKIFNMNSQ